MGSGMKRREFLVTGLAGSVVAVGMPAGAWGRPVPTSVVDTTSGKVRGKRVGGVSDFLGIPYGGNTALRRFLPAVAPTPWTGVRECVVLGHQAPQMALGPDGRSGPKPDMSSPFIKRLIAAATQGMEVGNESEDCLVINVYTPDPSPARKRPVMVWLHGGGMAIGSSGDPQYNGNALARHGDVVVVGLNHRLNALGFLYLGAFSDDFADSGNLGMLDIVFALEWVRDNIANFGGDPDNVTVFGESGGGAKVSFTLAMPPAKGRFHKAIIQSGATLVGLQKQKAVAHAERTLANLGVAQADVHRLRAMDYRRIIAAAKAAEEGDHSLLRPMVDGRSLPRDPFSPTAPQVSRDVPIMVGTTKDEDTLFMSADPLFGKMTDEQARQRAAHFLGAKASEALDLIKTLRPSYTPTYWLADLMTANGAWKRSIALAERKLVQHAGSVHMWRLDWVSYFDHGILKSPHGLDTDLVFDNPQTKSLMNGPGPQPREIAAVMSRAWINFARSGDPSQGGLRWPKYDTASRKTMIFDVRSHVVEDPDRPLRKLLVS